MSFEHDEIIASFVTEATEGLADIENDLLTLESGGSNVDSDLINKVFRAIHSIKGTAGFCGLTTINELAHEMENVLNLIRNDELVPTTAVVDPLLKSADCLTGMVNDIEGSTAIDVSGFITALQACIKADAPAEVQAKLDREIDIELEGGDLAFMMINEYELVSRQNQGLHIYVVDVDFIGDVQSQDRSPVDFLHQLYQCGEVISSYVSTAAIGSLAESIPDSLHFMILVASNHSIDDIAGELHLPNDRVHHIASPDQTDWGADGPSIPSTPPARSIASATANAGTTAPEGEPAARPEEAMAKAGAAPTTLRVNVDVLDSLMNLAGELVLSRNQLLQVISTTTATGLESVANRVDRITSELQEAIMQTRMQPVGTVFNKFPRLVRDLGSALGKECNLDIEGKGVELDKSIIEAIGDPLTHLVRNSIDHGVEMPDQRERNGKKRAGSILLRAYHAAGKVNIAIKDDGKGIDHEMMRTKAVEKGILTPEQAREISDREAIRLIFHPGFSTAEKITDVSGRGVGMDVVRTNIEKLGGTVDIDTKIGEGTTINIQLPLTLAIIPSLVFRCGAERFAIPQANIKELIRIRASQVQERINKVKDAELLRLRGELLPLVRLSVALDETSQYVDPSGRAHENKRLAIADRRAPVHEDAASIEPVDEDARSGSDRRDDMCAGALNIVVLETGEMRYGLIVDALDDSQEIVVKPLGRHMAGCRHLAGATILGDGQIALILDAMGLAAHCQLRQVEDANETDDRASEVSEDNSQSVLIFTNHPDESFAVASSMISRIERTEASKVDRVGGIDVLEYQGTSLPLISLEHHIRAEARTDAETFFVIVFSIAGRDIGLIAPTLADIRTVTTSIDTVTFREPGILGSQVVEGRVVRFIDIVSLARIVQPEWFAGGNLGSEPRSGRILLAEDSGFFRNQVASFLESEGYEVVACEDGQEAWDAIRDGEPFDLVVTDIEMPRMDGLEFTRQMRGDSRFAHLPVIALTSLAADDDVQRGVTAGVTDYQVKMDREKLLTAVRQLALQSSSRTAVANVSGSAA